MTRRAAIATAGGSRPALVLGFVVLLLFLVLAVAVIGFAEVIDLFGGSKGFALSGFLPALLPPGSWSHRGIFRASIGNEKGRRNGRPSMKQAKQQDA